ncbi:MAG: type II transport protein [Gammaproteobacteria bacterium]|nr:type II transport protein [Gammaproteobacteria bacterium]MBT3858957.1 type II transport protein [Gammaproteobacteria bacterium]MBT3988285.1 type II transport protein [Gammaproteobacteria bacterium]MBT4256469.1 type II transport protein [Gammaproteobacteria bacterium]MBT4582555.1 type II transport protein [Gammaproteobacteria bacterium]
MLKQLGFTLLEALITILILIILGSISLPGFKNMIEKHRNELTMRKMLTAIEFAKSSAITRSTLVTICRSNDGLQCSGEWRDGVIVFSDENGNREIDDDDFLIQYFRFDGFEGEIMWRAFQNRQYLQITKLGFTRYQNGNFTFCPKEVNPALANQLIINRTARVRIAGDTNGDGIKEDSRGRPIRC